MRNGYVLLAMIFLHVVEDFHLQGILASMKQKKWWEDQVPGLRTSQYKRDYILALIVHAFEWSFFIMLPMLVQIWIGQGEAGSWYVGLLLANTIVHAIVDHMKANRNEIDLWEDQAIHLFQIFITWALWPLPF